MTAVVTVAAKLHLCQALFWARDMHFILSPSPQPQEGGPRDNSSCGWENWGSENVSNFPKGTESKDLAGAFTILSDNVWIMYSPLCDANLKCEFIPGNICINRRNSKSCMGSRPSYQSGTVAILELLLTKSKPSPRLPGESGDGEGDFPLVKVAMPQTVRFPGSLLPQSPSASCPPFFLTLLFPGVVRWSQP